MKLSCQRGMKLRLLDGMQGLTGGAYCDTKSLSVEQSKDFFQRSLFPPTHSRSLFHLFSRWASCYFAQPMQEYEIFSNLNELVKRGIPARIPFRGNVM
jgi:hypothetical protein